MSLIAVLLGVFTFVGGVVCTIGGILAAYYILTRRPTPDATIREAVTSIRWSYALAFFTLPCAAVGFQESGTLLGAFGGAAFGSSFVGLLVALQWWWGPI